LQQFLAQANAINVHSTAQPLFCGLSNEKVNRSFFSIRVSKQFRGKYVIDLCEIILHNKTIKSKFNESESYYYYLNHQKHSRMKNKKQFGETVAGYNIPVLNEREMRAAAGILFLAVFISLMLIIFKQNFVPIKYIITVFLIDFFIRVFVNPKYSPSLIIGRMIVSNQNPEYVGAPQKKFAWVIGFVLALIMFALMVVLNTYSAISGIICLICLIFLFFESAFGICLGCKFYGWFNKEKAQYCPGEVCDVKAKHDIQKTSLKQMGAFVLFLGFIIATVYFFNYYISVAPRDLWVMINLSLAN